MIFPTETKPSNNFWEPGVWSFGARRDGGKRKHAGVDMYLPEGTPIVAMESFRITRITDSFYLGTGCIEGIGTYAIRYGEIKPAELDSCYGVPEGSVIGWVKKCEGIKQSMLHIEVYGMGAFGKVLTDTHNPPFYRSFGLIDPTVMLNNLYQKKWNSIPQ